VTPARERVPPSPDSLLVLVERAENRRLLTGHLGERYAVETDPDVDPEAVDLCLVDAPAYRTHRDRLAALKQAADPLYVPVLLVGDEAAAETATGVVDESISTPVRTAELDRRVEALLRARSLSLAAVERERQYRDLVDLLPEAVCIQVDGHVEYANRMALDLLGSDENGDVVGRSLAPLLREHAPEVVAALEGAASDRSAFQAVEMRPLGGEPFHAEVGTVPVQFEGADGVQVVIRDVTERDQRRERLQLYAEALDEAELGITVADVTRPDDPLIYVNKGFERLTGYDTEAALDENCRFLQGEGTDEQTVARIRRAIEQGERHQAVLLNYRRDGTPFWNELTLTPISDESGAVTHYLGFQRDVTSRHRREQQLSVLDRILRHNLRNRLTVIRGHAEHIQYGADDPADHAEAIVEAAEELRSLSDKAGRFREVVDQGTLHDLPRRDLTTLAERAVRRCRGTYAGADISLTAPASAPVRAHGSLELALGELLDNAVVHAEAETPTVAVTVTADEETVTVAVTDEGPGMPLEEWPDDTGVETQLEHASSLGLWLVVWAVEQSAGQVDVDSDEGGTTVTLSFRRATSE
jgi:PAS domain S-box-containing protein